MAEFRLQSERCCMVREGKNHSAHKSRAGQSSESWNSLQRRLWSRCMKLEGCCSGPVLQYYYCSTAHDNRLNREAGSKSSRAGQLTAAWIELGRVFSCEGEEPVRNSDTGGRCGPVKVIMHDRRGPGKRLRAPEMCYCIISFQHMYSEAPIYCSIGLHIHSSTGRLSRRSCRVIVDPCHWFALSV